MSLLWLSESVLQMFACSERKKKERESREGDENKALNFSSRLFFHSYYKAWMEAELLSGFGLQWSAVNVVTLWAQKSAGSGWLNWVAHCGQQSLGAPSIEPSGLRSLAAPDWLLAGKAAAPFGTPLGPLCSADVPSGCSQLWALGDSTFSTRNRTQTTWDILWFFAIANMVS